MLPAINATWSVKGSLSTVCLNDEPCPGVQGWNVTGVRWIKKVTAHECCSPEWFSKFSKAGGGSSVKHAQLEIRNVPKILLSVV